VVKLPTEPAIRDAKHQKPDMKKREPNI